jgi:succinate-semialdehyde dehydrogenase/glutarate-semialdehyde dehydrogenase
MRDRWLIGAEAVDAAAGPPIHVRDPASDSVIATLPRAGVREAAWAMDVASRSLETWRLVPTATRAAILQRAADTLLARRDDLARVITLESGKPLLESQGEVRYAADYLRSAAEQAERLADEHLDPHRPDVGAIAVHEPIGVCAAITPWNFPLAMLARKVAPALAAGCTVLAKPAEETPLSALALADALLACELPSGVLNVIAGDAPAIASTWLADPRLRKLTFTGSTETGRLLLRGAADQVVRCSMELGGHAAFIVLPGADLDAAVAGAMAAKFRNAGQTCICPNRLLVHRSLAAPFAARLAMAASQLVVGPGTEPASNMGPLIHDDALTKVRLHVQDALDRGGRLVAGGHTLSLPHRPDRFFLPTVITACHPEMLCFREETFGPVAPIMTVGSAEEAVSVANASPWGLAGYVFGPADAAESVARRLACGVVGVNEAAPSNAYAPFGGVKWSGFGREGGRWGVREYLSVKYLAIRKAGGP